MLNGVSQCPNFGNLLPPDSGIRDGSRSVSGEFTSDGPVVDVAQVSDDGQHLITLCSRRAPHNPPGRPDILDRFIRDALAPGVDPAEGHRACARYEMETRINLITASTLLIGADSDPFAFPEVPRLRAGLVNATRIEEVTIVGGQIPVMEQNPLKVAESVRAFIRRC